MILKGSLATGGTSSIGSLLLDAAGMLGSRCWVEGSSISGLDGPSSSSYCSSPEPAFSFPLDVPSAHAPSSSSVDHVEPTTLATGLRAGSNDSECQWGNCSAAVGLSCASPVVLRSLAVGNSTVLFPEVKPILCRFVTHQPPGTSINNWSAIGVEISVRGNEKGVTMHIRFLGQVGNLSSDCSGRRFWNLLTLWVLWSFVKTDLKLTVGSKM